MHMQYIMTQIVSYPGQFLHIYFNILSKDWLFKILTVGIWPFIGIIQLFMPKRHPAKDKICNA